MAVTLQMIAERAGVSRGTVDRALNNRGHIRPEIEKKIKSIALELGYQPSRAGRALALAKKNVKIGVILQAAETPFMKDVAKGARTARQEIQSLGAEAEIHELESISAGAVIEVMEKMREEEISAIALMPSEDELLKRTIDRFIDEEHIPIVTLNSDLETTRRLSFVGQNTLQSGKVAGELMGEIVHGQGKVCVISGHPSNVSLKNRTKGFLEEVKENYPQLGTPEVHYCFEDHWVAGKLVEEIAGKTPELAGIYITGGGENGVCEKIKELELEKQVKIIAHDFQGKNREYLLEGTINFLIGQDAYTQGYEPVMMLFRLILDGEMPVEKLQYTDIVIKTKYNME